MRRESFITGTTGTIGLQCVQRALLQRLLAPYVCNAYRELYYRDYWHHRSAMRTESFLIETTGRIGLQCVQRALLQRLLPPEVCNAYRKV